MVRRLNILLLIFILGSSLSAYADSISVVTTNTILEDVVKKVGGEQVDIYTVASPRRDFHNMKATPKDILRVKKADMLFYLGDDAEPWLNPLLRASGNQSFITKKQGLVNVSNGIELLDIPETLSRLEGDIHSGGNPHYWLNPENYLIMIRSVEVALSSYAPNQQNYFKNRAEASTQQLQKKIETWKEIAAPLVGKKFISYHRSWSYFAQYFGLISKGEIEPKPGIPATAQHIARLIAIAKSEGVDFILRESYFESGSSEKLAQKTGARAVEMLQFVMQEKSIDDYIALIEFNLNRLLNKS